MLMPGVAASPASRGLLMIVWRKLDRVGRSGQKSDKKKEKNYYSLQHKNMKSWCGWRWRCWCWRWRWFSATRLHMYVYIYVCMYVYIDLCSILHHKYCTRKGKAWNVWNDDLNKVVVCLQFGFHSFSYPSIHPSIHPKIQNERKK